MRLADCVNTADIQTLRKIAQHYGFTCSLYSKHELLQEILFTFRGTKFLAEHTEHWRNRWGSIFVRLCLADRSSFSVEEIQAMFQSLGPEAGSIDDAVAEGWLFPTKHIHGRPCYLIPDELAASMRDQVMAHWATQIRKSTEGPLIFREEEHACVRDLDVLLEYILHHDVQLTTGGAMYKRHQQQLLALLEVEEQPLEGGWRFGYGRRIHDYPDRLALLYDFAFHRNLIEETQQGRLVCAPEALEWRKQDVMSRHKLMLQFYISLYRRPIPRLPQLVRIVAAIADGWVESLSLYRAVQSLVNKFYYDEPEDVWQVRIIKMMTHLGLLRTGEDESGSTWFQITNLGQQLLTSESIAKPTEEARERERILIVQPNFDVMVTADQPLITLELAKFTDLKETGAVRLYRISEDSVQRGIAAGHSLTAWLAFVAEHAHSSIPGNVERTLQDWAGRAEPESTSDSLLS